jgi:aspartate racemase
MKSIGLLGGMSWESTAVYYRLLNEGVRARLGGLHSASLVLWQVDFDRVARLQAEGRWEEAGALLAEGARALERAGAGLVALATNTMHVVSAPLQAALSVPFVHIVDVTARAARGRGVERLGLLGTRYTMTSPYFPARYAEGGVEVRVPGEAERARVHAVIYEELCRGVVSDASRREVAGVVRGLAAAGAQAVALGCTELGMLLREGDVEVPLLDTTALHCEALLDAALG